MKKFATLYFFIKYFFSAHGRHGLHSPFVYHFYDQVITGKVDGSNFIEVEKRRKALKNNHTVISVKDFGAGSKVSNSSSRKISSIAKNSEKGVKLSRLINRIITFQQAEIILDLGTSFGITTVYQALGNPQSNVHSFEGCPATAAIARESFKQLNIQNIQLHVGNIDETLPMLLQQVPKIDFVFFDANHRYAPTLHYFNLCLAKATEDSIFVFDDIYWSMEMKQAWEEIKKNPKVGLTIDLFYIGIVFFRKKQPTQHFTLTF